MNSFIPRVGGKKLLRDTIVKAFPPDGYDRYIEVFGGAAWVLFHRDKHAPMEVYNDLDGGLVNLFRCVKHHPEAVQQELAFRLNAREMFEDDLAHLTTRGMTDIQRAAMQYAILKNSFGADCRTYGKLPVSQAAIARFGEVQERLKSVIIENKSYEDLIKVYDRKTALFYCDPPYHGTESIYKAAFTQADHQHLRDILGGIQGRFVLSYNDDEFVRDLYHGYNIETVERASNLTGTYKRKSDRYREVIIRNY